MTRARDIAGRYLGTLKADTISHPSASTAAITFDSAGAMTGSFPYPNRNLLYNGAMQVTQRGTSATSITTTGYYTADRWNTVITTQGTWTQTVENDAPTGSGLSKSLKMLCTTADASPASSDIIAILQNLEGQDLQRIAKGTVSAQQLTLSFWVKSNVTGTYTAWLFDADNSRAISASYSVLASATWERKIITFAADTTGVFTNDNTTGLQVYFNLGVGSSWSSGTLSSSWQAYTQANVAVGQTNLAAATNNYWQITGVQLEVGPVATSFEFKSYGQELRECQRYYYLHASGGSKPIATGVLPNATSVYCMVQFPVSMRTSPSLVATSGTDYYYFYKNAAADYFNSFTIGDVTNTIAQIYNVTEISGTTGQAGFVEISNASGSVAFSAEL